MDWKHKDTWKLESNGFVVEVSRHDKYSDGAENGWAVYAYVFRAHPLFAKLDCGHDHDYYVIPELNALPLHWGCTYFQRHDRDGKTVSIQVGADYSHLHDDRFLSKTTKEDAYEVFADAEELFATLKRQAEEAVAAKVAL